MIPLTPPRRIFLATGPLAFRKGIDRLAAVGRQRLGGQPLAGAVSVFRNRSGTSLNLVLDDGQGDGLMMKR
jgi:transposase